MMGSLRSQFFLTKKLNEAIMRGPGSPASFLFRLIIPLTAAFVITILALIATLFGDERAPFPRLLNRYGNVMLVVEFLAIVVVTLMAIMQDQKRIRAGESGADVADEAAREAGAGDSVVAVPVEQQVSTADGSRTLTAAESAGSGGEDQSDG